MSDSVKVWVTINGYYHVDPSHYQEPDGTPITSAQRVVEIDSQLDAFELLDICEDVEIDVRLVGK